MKSHVIDKNVFQFRESSALEINMTVSDRLGGVDLGARGRGFDPRPGLAEYFRKCGHDLPTLVLRTLWLAFAPTRWCQD